MPSEPTGAAGRCRVSSNSGAKNINARVSISCDNTVTSRRRYVVNVPAAGSRAADNGVINGATADRSACKGCATYKFRIREGNTNWFSIRHCLLLMLSYAIQRPSTCAGFTSAEELCGASRSNNSRQSQPIVQPVPATSVITPDAGAVYVNNRQVKRRADFNARWQSSFKISVTVGSV